MKVRVTYCSSRVRELVNIERKWQPFIVPVADSLYHREKKLLKVNFITKM